MNTNLRQNGKLYLVNLGFIFKQDGYPFRGGNSKCVFFPSEKESTLKAPGRKFFPFRVDFFSERFCCVGMQTGNYKSDLSCKKNSRNLPVS